MSVGTPIESLWLRWTRRAATLPLFAALALAWTLLLPLSLALAFAVDTIRGNRRFVLARVVGVIEVYLLAEVLGVIATFAIWLGWGFATVDRRPYQYANFRLQCLWGRCIFRAAERLLGLQVELEGREQVGKGPVLVFMRHASVADTLLPVVFLGDPLGLRLRWVLKRELLWDPCLDIVGQRLPNAFVRRGSGAADREIAAVRALASDIGSGEGVLIYPEGTRFTPAKRERAIAHLESSGARARADRARTWAQVLPPRPGGALGLLDERPDVDVLFFAHSGLEGVVSLADLWNGSAVGARVRMKLWRVAASEIPASPAWRLDWLDRQWAEVDEWVAEAAGRTR